MALLVSYTRKIQHSNICNYSKFFCFFNNKRQFFRSVPISALGSAECADSATVSRIFSHTVTEQSHSGQRGCYAPLAGRSGVVPAGYNLSGLLVNVLLRPVVEVVRLFGEPFQDFLFGFLRVPFVAEPASVGFSFFPCPNSIKENVP